jgi:carbon starvation protein
MDKWSYTWVTFVPLGWLCSVTMTASYQKIFAENPRVGFLSHARALAAQVAAGAIPAHQAAATSRLILNDRLDAAVTGIFAVLVVVILAESARQWWLYATRRKRPVLNESVVTVSRFVPSEASEIL